jgi:ABC-type transport system involved in multi-copper enzyme maturation permease subunit
VNVILSIAKTTVGEAVRRRILLVILLIGILFLVIAPSLNMLTARQETTVLKSLTLGIIMGTSAVIALVLTVYMLPIEVERRTIYTILSKPVQRWQFLLGKYFGAIGALGLMIALMTFTLLFVYAVMQSEDKPAPQIALFIGLLFALIVAASKLKEKAGGPLIIGVLAAGLMATLYWIGMLTTQLEIFGEFGRTAAMIYVQMCLLAAVGVFFSTFASPVVNFFLSGGVFMIGSVFNSLFEDIEKNATLPLYAQWILKGIQSFLPNFQNFQVQNTAINAQAVIRGETYHYLNLAGYGFVYVAVLLILAILIFDRKEV